MGKKYREVGRVYAPEKEKESGCGPMIGGVVFVIIILALIGK
ncbi:hypothetical protein [Cerasicoccus frondis]|nr:hypothetical protein [Cerasicoccus frondis]